MLHCYLTINSNLDDNKYNVNFDSYSPHKQSSYLEVKNCRPGSTVINFSRNVVTGKRVKEYYIVMRQKSSTHTITCINLMTGKPVAFENNVKVVPFTVRIDATYNKMPDFVNFCDLPYGTIFLNNDNNMYCLKILENYLYGNFIELYTGDTKEIERKNKKVLPLVFV